MGLQTLEHRGAGPAIVWPADLMLRELRLEKARRNESALSQRSTDLYNAVFQLEECDRPLAGSILLLDGTVGTVGKANPLSFTLAGEYVEDIN